VSIAEERQEGGRTIIVLTGSFDATEAHRLLEVVAKLPRSARVSVDFHEARLVDDCAFATLAGHLSPDREPYVELVGLSNHLHRLLRYIGSKSVLH
jgi:hypothetical protein